MRKLRFSTSMYLSFAVGTAVLLCAAMPAVSADQLTLDVKRDCASLLGQWQSLSDHPDAELFVPEKAEKAGEWKNVQVPGQLMPGVPSKDQASVKCVWARREFKLDKSQAARDAVLNWRSINFGSTIWINGQKVGSQETIGPGTCLLKPGLLKEGANQIVIRVTGWASVARSKSGFPLIPAGASNTQGWGSKASNISDIWIEFYDGVYMKSLLAIPSLKDKKVTLRVWVDSAAQLPAEIQFQATLTAPEKSEAKPVVIKFPLTKGVKSGKAIDFEIPIPSPLAWTLKTPHLYTLSVTALADGKPCDDASFRFGMRDITVESGHYRLNGQPFWLRGSNMVGEWNWDKAHADNAKRYLIDEARLMNLNSFRTHTGPPITSWCDIADAEGMFFLAELPVLVNTFDMKFTPEEREVWRANILLTAEAYIRRLWNHPSVFTWVLSNESGRDNAWESGEYTAFVMALDPTRPAMRASGGGGTPYTLDIHTCANTSRGAEGWVIERLIEEARKKDPKRTLGNSEYMNRGAAKQSERWLGQDKVRAEAEIVYAQLGSEHSEAMRRLQYDLMLPYMYAGWTSFGPEPGTKTWRDPYPTAMAASLHSCMAPVLASLDLFDANYVAGAEVTTPLVIINELGQDVDAKIDLYVTPHNPLFLPDDKAVKAAVSHQKLDQLIKANSHSSKKVTWKLPTEPGVYYIAAVVTRDGDRPVVSQRELRVLAAPTTAKRLKDVELVVLGADAAAVKWLKDSGAKVTTTVGQDKPKASAVVVWNLKDITDNERASAAMIRDYVSAGGRVVILDQLKWDWTDLLDMKLLGLGSKGELEYQSRAEAATSRAFPAKDMSKHPLLDGLPAEALRRWNGLPGTIADRCLDLGRLKDATAILWAEDPKNVVAASIPLGKGQIIVSMLHARSRIDGPTCDPAAVQLLLNLLAPPAQK